MVVIKKQNMGLEMLAKCGQFSTNEVLEGFSPQSQAVQGEVSHSIYQCFG